MSAMNMITYLMSSMTSDIKTLIIGALIGLITYKVARFYINVLRYPKGPFPLPILGNILMFRGKKQNNFLTMMDMQKKYGDIFTFWAGHRPFVVILDLDLAKDAFNRSEFLGRLEFSTVEYITNKKCSDIIFDDFGPRWSSNRRVAHIAVRKYAVTDQLATLCSDVVDDLIKVILKKEGPSKPFCPNEYLFLCFYNIIASSAFGQRYTPDDPEFKRFRRLHATINEPSTLLTLMEFIPLLRYIFKMKRDKVLGEFKEFIDLIKEKYYGRLKDFDEQVTRDFCDALISAKREAIAEAKESAPYLTDDNLALAVFDLFLAGTDTSQYTTRWAMLLLANHPFYQRKMRQEVTEVIGDRIPLLEDRNNCHWVMAFILEVLRYRNVTPLGVAHKTMVDSKIGKMFIPKDTSVMIHQFGIMHNQKHFAEPKQFNPRRFLDDQNRLLAHKPAAFIPFSIGRRVCLGEKLAMADLFLVIVRLLQATSGFEWTLPGGPGTGDLDPEPDQEGNCFPKNYEIMLKKCSP